MDIIYQNKNNKEYEHLFDELIKDTFGFSFAPWFKMELWDERYESFSFIENSKMLSNICLFKTELVVNNKPLIAYQLGAVATTKDMRGKGLSKRLMRHILNIYPNTPMFLFANEGVLDFYPRFGFSRVYESCPYIEYCVNNSNLPVYRLEPDHPLVKSYFSNSRRYSKIMSCNRIESVEMFHLLLSYKNDIYHIPSLDTLVVAQADGDELFVAYINKPEETEFESLMRQLPFSNIRNIRFGFVPDLLVPSCEWRYMESGDEAMFIRGGIVLPEPFAFPALAKT